MYFNHSLTPIIHQGIHQTQSHSYSVEYLTHIIFCESVLGVNHMPYSQDFAHFGQKINSKSKWDWSKEKRHKTVDFKRPATFAVSIKTQLYGYFYCKNKSLAILLTLLVLALLLRKLSTMGGVVKDNCDFSLLVYIIVWPTKQQQNGEKSTIPNYSTPPSPD